MENNRIKLGMVITMHSDLPKSVEFYKMLGLKLNFHMEGQWAEFGLNGIKFGMCPTTEKYDNVRTGIVLEIEEDLMAFYEEFKKKGVTFVNEPQVAPHGVMVGLKDPCGNVLDLYQATPEKMKAFAKENIAKKNPLEKHTHDEDGNYKKLTEEEFEKLKAEQNYEAGKKARDSDTEA